MARILVTGTLAIDYIATYPGVFAGLPRHAGINLSIHLDKIDRRFGGCAMNIVYSLKLLGHEPIPFVFVGDDFDGDYQRHLERFGIERNGIIAVPGATYSSHAFIFTDQNNNQFTGFYPGPARVEDFAERLSAFIDANEFRYAVVAPDVPENMITAAAILNDKGVPFLSDPGQGLTDFTPDDIRGFLALSGELIVNEFE